MGQVQANKAALNKCADVLRDSLDRLEKTKQTDVNFIFSSLVADLLPPKLANAWAEKTQSVREVTSARDLITFLKDKADQPYFHEVYSTLMRRRPTSRQKSRGLLMWQWHSHCHSQQQSLNLCTTPMPKHQATIRDQEGQRIMLSTCAGTPVQAATNCIMPSTAVPSRA